MKVLRKILIYSRLKEMPAVIIQQAYMIIY